MKTAAATQMTSSNAPVIRSAVMPVPDKAVLDKAAFTSDMADLPSCERSCCRERASPVEFAFLFIVPPRVRDASRPWRQKVETAVALY
jgi:hypothetical protein